MKHMLLAACAMLPALTLTACYDDGYYGGVGYAGGPYAYDGYYDDYYGPVYDGYWGDDGFFYYSDGHGGHVRDDGHHYRHERFEHGTRFHGDHYDRHDH